MKGTLFSAAFVSLSVLVAPAAHADSPDTFHGGCFYDTVSQPSYPRTDPATYPGVIGDRSRTTAGDSPATPISATVTCWIEINHAVAPGTTHTYGDLAGVPGVQAGADPVSFTASDTDWVTLCHTIAFADGTTQSGCEGPVVIQIPPECPLGTCDTLGTIHRLFVNVVDPVVCPVLAQGAGDYPGGVTVDPTGDVFVPDPFDLGLNPIYDCPPYVVVA